MESQESGSPNGQRDDGSRTFGQRVDRVSDTAQQAWTRTRQALGDIKGNLDIEGRVDRHPYGMVAAAVGIGYVLGGGLFSRLTARMLGLGIRMGLRLAALPLIKDEIGELVGTLDGGGDAGSDESGSKGRKTKQSTNKGR